ncbi:ABC transporter ATP-binding protein [Anaerosporobacter sp.]|uniref:ABC transporter ATP-binding protein n=1 Tax=Anaerosporobacter sp. TaxID=1872529 RepID=UPI00286F1244|nr:ABC transporter ATP-binding protein [Anaerosporobacter sp.]
MPLLQVKDLEVVFEKEHKEFVCVDKVNFHVNEGEILCIVGESGCGKSVTALSIMGLLGQQGRVRSGEVLFEGKDLLQQKEKELDQVRGNEIAMVFQDVMNCLNPCFTIGNQMAESIRIHLGYDKKKTKEHAIELLERVGLPDAKSIMKKYPHMLSGGMRQRVMIAMALVCRPKLLIADEPTTALDVTIQLQIMKLLLELREEFQMSILLITHDIGVVAEVADRVVVMYAGQCVEEAEVHSLFENPAHHYTEALLQSVPTIYDDYERELESIPGAVPENYQDLEGCRFADRCRFATKECYERQEYYEFEPKHWVRCRKELLNHAK